MKHFKTGLVLGRFQPFHNGHLYLLKIALKHADKIIIAVGSSNKRDDNNPISYQARVKMLEKVIAEEGITDRVIKIVPIPDNPSNEVWLKQLLKKTGGFDIQFGNNAWPNEILKEAGYEVMIVPHINRAEYEGVTIRAILKENGRWQKRVPAYLVDFIKQKLIY